MAAYKTLDASNQPLEPRHDCCYFCSTICKCVGESCGAAVLLFEASDPEVEENVVTFETQRKVTPQDRNTLREGLQEVLHDMRSEGIAMDESCSHGLSIQLIEDVSRNCETIFTLQDLLTRFPVFSTSNVLRVLEVIIDIPNFEESVALLNLHGSTAESDANKWVDFGDIELGLEIYTDTELLEL